jgi:exodeoxyribonuclease VII large subunit
VGCRCFPQAAALRDVITALRRRVPHVRIILYPTPVQGEAAAQKIADAIARASARKECDVLLVCRGGGSIEDLWCFNQEAVARAIASCAMPVVSGVGHETDFTIADFAADLRAPTPTAAAELACAPRVDWLAALAAQADDLTRALRRSLAELAQQLDWLARGLRSPASAGKSERARLSGLQLRLSHALRASLNQARHALHHLEKRRTNRFPDTANARFRLCAVSRTLVKQSASNVALRRQVLASLQTQLENLHPQRTLERGFAIVRDTHGNIVRSAAQLQTGQSFELILAQGSAQARVEKTKD